MTATPDNPAFEQKRKMDEVYTGTVHMQNVTMHPLTFRQQLIVSIAGGASHINLGSPQGYASYVLALTDAIIEAEEARERL